MKRISFICLAFFSSCQLNPNSNRTPSSVETKLLCADALKIISTPSHSLDSLSGKANFLMRIVSSNRGESFSEKDILASALRSTHPEKFNALWNNITEKDLKKIIAYVEKGKISTSSLSGASEEELITFLGFLREFHYKGKSKNFFQRVVSKYPELGSGGARSEIGGVIGGKDTYAMTEITKEILNDLVAKSFHARVGRGTAWQRFWSHPVHKMKRIIKFNNLFRHQMQHHEEFSPLVYDVMKSTLLEENMSLREMDALLESMKSVRKSSIDDLERVYQQDILTGGIIVDENIDIYKIVKQIEKLEAERKMNPEDHLKKAHSEYEKLLNQFEELFLKVRPEFRDQSPDALFKTKIEKFFDPALKIRHRQFQGVRRAKKAGENAAYNKDTKKRIHYTIRYTVTETYYVSQYDSATKTTRMVPKQKLVTKYHSTSEFPTYSEVVDDNLSGFTYGSSKTSPSGISGTISSTNVGSVRDYFVNIRRAESPLRQSYKKQLSKFKELLSHHDLLLAVNDASEIQRAQTTIKNILSSLEESEKEALRLSELSDTRIKSIVGSEPISQFKDRMSRSSESFRALRSLVTIYQEQFNRRQPDLVIEALTPDYSPQMSVLRRRANLRLAGRIVAAGTMSAASLCSILVEKGLYEEIKNPKESLKECLEDIKSLPKN